MIDPRRKFDRTTTPRVQDETNYNYNFSQNVPFYPFLSLNRIMLTYPSLTNTKFHLEKKKKGGGKNDTKETTGSQRYEVSSYSRVYPVTPVTLVACI